MTVSWQNTERHWCSSRNWVCWFQNQPASIPFTTYFINKSARSHSLFYTRSYPFSTEVVLRLVPVNFLSSSCFNRQRPSPSTENQFLAGPSSFSGLEQRTTMSGAGVGLNSTIHYDHQFLQYTTENTKMKPKQQWSMEDTNCLPTVWAKTCLRANIVCNGCSRVRPVHGSNY